MSETRQLLAGITVADEPVILDHEAQVATLLRDWLSPTWATRRTSQPLGGDDRAAGYHLDPRHTTPLPRFNYAPPPDLQINELYWPTGASRWSQMTVLMTLESASRAIHEAWGGDWVDGKWLTPQTVEGGNLLRLHGKPIPVVIRYNDLDTTTNLYILDFRPISYTNSPQGLVAVRLVDERFFWQQMGFGASCYGRPASGPPDPSYPYREIGSWLNWNQLFAELFRSAHVTSFHVEQRIVDRKYPDPIEWSRPFEPVGLLLDAACATLGGRLIRTFAGDVEVHDPKSAEDAWNELTNPQPGNSHGNYRILGLDRFSAPRAERYLVAFPRNVAGHLCYGRRKFVWLLVCNGWNNSNDPWSATVIDAEENTWSGAGLTAYGVEGVTHTIFCSQYAYYEATDDDAPQNIVDLQTTAISLANDRQAWSQRLFYARDVVLTDILAKKPSAFMDYMTYSFGTEFPTRPYVTQSGDKKASLVQGYQRRLTTTIVSFDEDMHSSHAILQGTEPLLPERPLFQLQEQNSSLMPGGSAVATHVAWQEDDSSYDDAHVPNSMNCTIHDPLHICCALQGEVVQCQWNPDQERWEVATPHGLRRHALVTTADGISPGLSGQLQIVRDDDPSPYSITAYLCWMESGKALRANQEVAAWYNSDEKRWIIDGAEC